MSTWRNFHGQEIESTLASKIESDYIRLKAEGHSIRLCIGTDSHIQGEWVIFATVVVVVLIGNGGFMYVRKIRNRIPLTLKERMMSEIAYSIEAAMELHDFAETHKISMEIHADINQNPRFPSYVSYHDALGYIVGMGYRFVSKPDAFASSVCADRFCH